MLTLFKVENPDFRAEALARLNRSAETRRERFVKTEIEKRKNLALNNVRIKKEVKKIILAELNILINGKVAKPGKHFKGEDGKKVSAWDLVLLMAHGEQFLLNFGDPAVNLNECRRKILSCLPAWDFPSIGLLANRKEVSKRYDHGRPDEIWENYKVGFEVK